MRLTCPHCQGGIDVTMNVAGAKQRRQREVNPKGAGYWKGAPRAVAAFARSLEPGEWPNKELREAYAEWAPGRGAKPLSGLWLSKLLAAAGHEPYRTSTERGFLILENAVPVIQQQRAAAELERTKAQNLRDAVVESVTGQRYHPEPDPTANGFAAPWYQADVEAYQAQLRELKDAAATMPTNEEDHHG